MDTLGGWLTKERVLIQQKNDELKNQYCMSNNIPLIRITSFDMIEPTLKEQIKLCED